MRIGNAKGWMIAGVVAVLYLGGVYALESSGSASAPTELARSELLREELSLPAGARSIVEMTDGRDATPILERMVKEVTERPSAYERFRAEDIPRLAALTDLLAQRPLAAATARAADVAGRVGYKAGRAELEAFEGVGMAAQRAALLLRAQKRLPEAREFFEAEYALGYKLFQARMSYAEVIAARRLLADGVAGLKMLAKDEGDTAAQEKLAAFEAALAEATNRERPLWEAISTVDPVIMGRHNGDIPVIARSAKERVWRVEATLKLGRLKYAVGRGGTAVDQRNARRVIRSLEGDPDPAVAQAARLAGELSVEEYRALR